MLQTITCTTTSSCPLPQSCVGATALTPGICTPIVCTIDSNCRGGYVCQNTACVPNGCLSCLTTQQCLANICVPIPCTTTCSNNLVCIGGFCAINACTSCPVTSPCLLNVCTPIVCTADSNCPNGYVCLGTACVLDGCTNCLITQ